MVHRFILHIAGDTVMSDSLDHAEVDVIVGGWALSE
jgi:hypothetical protein